MHRVIGTLEFNHSLQQRSVLPTKQNISPFPVRRNLIIPLHITATPNQTDKVARKMGKCFCRSLQLFFSDTSRLI
jgi:hypothetical protein